MLLLVFVAGTMGRYVPTAVVSILTIGYTLSLSGAFDKGGESDLIPGGIFMVFAISLAVLSFAVWKKHYDENSDPDLKNLNLQIKSRQAQSEILVQSIADGVVVFNPEGKITLINPAAAAMTEWPADEAAGIDVHAVMKLSQEDGSPLDPTSDLFTKVLTNKEHVNKTLTLQGRSGNRRTIVSLVLSPIVIPKTEEVAGAVALFRDVSEAKREEQRRADFVSTASHEMRTPVAAIEGYLALALNPKVSTLDDNARSYLEKAHASTQHLGELFQDLLTSSKAEDGRLSSHPDVVEAGQFMHRLRDDLKFAADKKGLGVKLVVGEEGTGQGGSLAKVIQPLYFVYADPDRLREVITNLFDNAVKYTEKGEITLGVTGNEDVVQFRVTDTGAGIPAADVPHLFQKFYRVDNTATRTIGGTGLGLFICRKIIDLYNGRIWVESQEGKGSTFYINLPRISAQKADQLKAASPAKNTPAPAPVPTPVNS
jgi:PAS domain S-box-containing protein